MAVPSWVSHFDNFNRPNANGNSSGLRPLTNDGTKLHRSQSLIPDSSWYDHRNQSLKFQPVRWHSNYQNNNDSSVSLPRKLSSPGNGLHTIPEDSWNDNEQYSNRLKYIKSVNDLTEQRERRQVFMSPNYGSHEHLLASSERVDSEKQARRPQRGINPPSRTRSEPDLVDAVHPKPPTKRKTSASPFLTPEVNSDTLSEKSEGRRSSRSAVSVASTNKSEFSKNINNSRRQSLSPSYRESVRRGSETNSIVKQPIHKYPSSPTSDSSPFAKIEIPVELLETPSRRLKKILGPVIMCVLAITLAGSLGIAVYFATVLKETQDKQIDFLHAHLEMSIRNQNINSLSSVQREMIAVTYCKTMDKFYIGSELRTVYRGCEVISLRNDKINFTLFFTDDRYTPGEVIIKVIQDKAPATNVPGTASRLVMVDQLTVDLATTKIKLETKKESENFNKIIFDDPGITTPIPRRQEDVTTSPTTFRTTSTTTVVSTTSQPTTTSAEATTSKSIATTASTNITTSLTSTITSSSTTSASNADRKTIKLESEHFSDSVLYLTTSKPIRTNIVSTEEPNPCHGKNGRGYYPHPTECNLYYECQNNKSVLLYCGEMVFDFTRNVCVVKTPEFDCPNNTIFKASSIPPDVINEVDKNRTAAPVYEWDPCSNHEGNYFPHPVECNLFFQCAHGKSVLTLCQSGLLYDWEAKVCTKKSPDVVCPDPSKAPPRPDNIESISPTQNSMYSNTVPYPTRPAYDREPCKTDTTDGHLFPHPDDCTKYIFCDQDVGKEMLCSGGLVFDPNINACRKSSSELPCPDFRPCKGINGGYFPHPTDCSKFIICEAEREIVQTCLHNLVWDYQQQSCVRKTDAIVCP
ncbi:hypothetical protein LOTGIDRAFT_232881 [Lottia gigantea]|uniref:Chitin-binding type-2 domain-containing protein n=1 Tax=Lottia gigantea TaxID=225164 RepID=V4A7L2_LOTGI|nr:hypothetical protein LOTGIDRAFT_232881 [Lottia gigantea]ESO92737.1 hypothetical protein LOTGIDRAFT_232881 [Lottia gigantea]